MNRMLDEAIASGRWRGVCAAVVGAGRSGLAAARLLARLGAQVRVLDANPALAPALAQSLPEGAVLETGAHTPAQFAGAGLVVLSTGVPVRKLAGVLAAVEPQRVVAELELASRFIEAPVLAITGTNGKTTTTTLAGAILAAAGRKVFVGGNIGTPLCDFVLAGAAADVVVLEVSSFQLQNCAGFRPRVGVLLNFSANHLDYHLDMEEYLAAKLKLFANQGPQDAAVLPESLRGLLEGRDFTKAERVWFAAGGLFPCPALPGAHNRANVEAAWQAVRRFGVTEEQARLAIAAFRGLQHRIETVGVKRGVLFVDDSKATNLDAVAAALASFDRPVRLLLGGVFKGGEVAGLLPVMAGRVLEVGLFGASREVFEQALAGHVPLSWSPKLDEAVHRLFAHAREGEVILLSPATASFDAYTSYAERGEHFRRIFGELAEPAEQEGA